MERIRNDVVPVGKGKQMEEARQVWQAGVYELHVPMPEDAEHVCQSWRSPVHVGHRHLLMHIAMRNYSKQLTARRQHTGFFTWLTYS